MILYFLQVFFMLYVIVKGAKELCLNNQAAEKGKPVYKSFIHANQHMVYLIAIIIYQIINIFTYSMFVSNYNYRAEEDIILWIKISFLNFIFLLMIHHFKQERLDKTETINLIDIFKF